MTESSLPPNPRPQPDALLQLLSRRSVKAMDLHTPGPDAESLERILQAGIRVPDHGKLGPWRILRFDVTACRRFGDLLAARRLELTPGAPAEMLDLERNRLLRAPVVLAVISSVTAHPKIPEWEQLLSAGAVCQNLLIAAMLSGFSAQWITEWYSYDESIAAALSLTEGERIAGFIHIGTAAAHPGERPRPELTQVVSDWG